MNKIPNEDTFGYCVRCGKRMIGHQVIDGIYKIKLSDEYTTVMFLLDDNSQMRVAMCKDCADSWDDNEPEKIEIMKKVFRGWQHEVETYSNWNENKKREYLNKYGQRRIITRADKISNDTLVTKLSEYKNNESKDKKNILMEKSNGVNK